MRIDLNRANDQARQMRLQSNRLQDARTQLLLLRSQLQRHWRGEEVEIIMRAINRLQSELMVATNNTAAIANEINSVANTIRREEDLAIARADLTQANNNVNTLRRSVQQAERQHSLDPTASTQRALNDSVNRLNNAMNQQSAATARVRVLSR